MNINEEPQQIAKVLIALTKESGRVKKILVPSMEGYETGYVVDGIFVEKDEEARIFALDDMEKPFGINSPDLPSTDKQYGKISSTIGGLEGEESTQTLIDIYGFAQGTACVDSQQYGWLPEGGEFDLALADIEKFNQLCEEAGGTPINSGRYWVSQRRNSNYAWFYDVEQNGYGAWVGGLSLLKVRPVMSAEGYKEVEV